MVKTTKITLAGQDYTVHAFNLDELEEIQDVLADESQAARRKAPGKIIAIALRRADPPIEKPGTIEATLPEIRQSMRVLMSLAGMELTENPPEAAPTAAAAGAN
jgi:hypothetical protein